MVNRRGIVPALWICGIVPDGLEPDLRGCRPGSATISTMLAVTISVENLAGGMGTAAFVAYLSSLCNIS